MRLAEMKRNFGEFREDEISFTELNETPPADRLKLPLITSTS